MTSGPGTANVVKKTVSNLAGSGVCYAAAVKAGPWVFVTGQEAFDLRTGTMTAGGPAVGPGRSRREGDLILARMGELLDEFGTDLSQGVRMDQFYSTPAAVNSYHQSRRRAFGSYIPPSTSVVVDRCFAATSSISAALVAITPDARHFIERVVPSGTDASAWQGVAPGVVCGDLVFVAGQMATDSGQALDPRAQVPAHMRWGASAVRRQTEYILRHKITPTLDAAGSSWEHVVKAQVYLDNADDLPDFLDVWSDHLGDIPCALTVVSATTLRLVGGVIEINLVAMRDGARNGKEVVDADLPDLASFGPCVRAGDFLFPSGLMGVADDGRVVGDTVSPALGGLAHAGHAQASAIYGYVDALCARQEPPSPMSCGRSTSSPISVTSPASPRRGPPDTRTNRTRSGACRYRA